MIERNMCSESCCKAFCCLNPDFPSMDVSEEQILTWWPDAVRVISLEVADILHKSGVFYMEGEVRYQVKIKGYCPNVDEKFSCSIEERKPELCKKFGLGQDDCTSTRLTYFIPPYCEWLYNQNRESSRVVK